jgi:hypothetical protein
MEVARPAWPSQPRGPRPDRYRPRFFSLTTRSSSSFARGRRREAQVEDHLRRWGEVLRYAPHPYVLGHGRARAHGRRRPGRCFASMATVYVSPSRGHGRPFGKLRAPGGRGYQGGYALIGQRLYKLVAMFCKLRRQFCPIRMNTSYIFKLKE